MRDYNNRFRIMNFSLATLVLVLVLVYGCTDFVGQGNAFENFDGPPAASEITRRHIRTDDEGNVIVDNPERFVRDVGDAAGSGRFFRDLSDSDREQLNDGLRQVYNGDSDVGTRQRAAVLAGEVNMRGTSAGTTANNVIDVLTGDGIEAFEDPNALLDTIIPAGARGNPAAIQEILNNMVAAAEAYEALGNTLGDEDSTVPAGTNMGVVAQNALVAMVVRDIVNAQSGDDPAARSEFLAQQLAEDPENRTIATPGEGDEDYDVFGGEGSALRNIINTAGFGGILEDD